MQPACGVCGKLYYSLSNLQRHIQNHCRGKPYTSYQYIPGEKYFTCGVCGKLYSQNVALHSHIKIHNNEKPYTCDFCGKSFSLSSYLHRHLRNHTDNVNLNGSPNFISKDEAVEEGSWARTADNTTSQSTPQLKEPTHNSGYTLLLEEPTHNPDYTLLYTRTSLNNDCYSISVKVNRPRLKPRLDQAINYDDPSDGEISSGSEKHPHEDTEKPRIRDVVAFESILLKPTQCSFVESLNKILAPMKNDIITRIVKSDDLILEFGKRECMRAGHTENLHRYIRCKLRELGRLLWQLRKNTFKFHVCLQYFIKPNQFSTIIKSVRDLAGFDFEACDFKIPSLAIQLRQAIKKCALIVKANALESNDKTLVETADNFCKLFKMKWETEISIDAYRTLNNTKDNNPQILPSNEVTNKNNVSTSKATTAKVPIKKIGWSEDEIIAIQAFKDILPLRIPRKKDIEEVQQRNPVLKSRSWKKIKDYCRNNKTKILKGQY